MFHLMHEFRAAAAKTMSTLSRLYCVMQTKESELGGGEGVVGVYGSITQAGMHTVLTCMQERTGMGVHSVMVDIGAGLGRPLLHALLEPGIRSGFGMDVDKVKVDKAAEFIQRVASTMSDTYGVDMISGERRLPIITCCNIEHLNGMGTATHAYSFWEGIPLVAKQAFGRLFRLSPSLKAVAVVQHAFRGGASASDAMRTLGFGEVQLVGRFRVCQQYSRSAYQAYIFKKLET